MKFNEINNEAKGYLKNNFWKLFFIVLLNYIITTIFSKFSNHFETTLFKLIYLIFLYAITIPLSYGVTISFIKTSRNESVSIFDFISDGMKSFKSIWKVVGRTILKLLFPIILLIIGIFLSIILFNFSILNLGSTNLLLLILSIIVSMILTILPAIYYIIKCFSYSLTNFILYDNPDLTAKEIVAESDKMMKGNKFTLLTIILYILLLFLALFAICIIVALILKTPIAVLASVIVILISAFLILPYSFALQVAFYNLLKENSTMKS